MTSVNRRGFLQLTAGAGAAAMLSQSVERAAALPARRKHGSIQDVEHVVILMQENRAFDSYFGSMRGVRGFGDPHPAIQRNGKSVFAQSDGVRDILPFHPGIPDLGRAFVVDLDHSWKETHEAFDLGWYDKWIQTKTPATMMHYLRRDMPWYFALADAFTICDAYHCSLLGPTDPNRYYMFTGWTGNDGKGGGPDLWNGEKGYDWMTYPERLLKAGVDWKVYQDIGEGLDPAHYEGWTSDPYIGNYGDNSLLYFHQYQNAKPGEPLYERARRGTDHKNGDDLFRILRADVAADKLPSVSWIAAPEAYTEHGNWPVDYGMWYVSQVLDALTSNPDVWAKTALFLVYDENDGFFDHVVPPHANSPQIPGASTVSTQFEYYEGKDDVPGNYGLGVRVPAMVISPWSTGGWVNSELFDATSLIRFLEKRFGVMEPQISPWRRAVCGDFTSAFDFGRKVTARPSLPDTSGLAPKDRLRHPDFIPVPPVKGSMPHQEPGVRPSRALGYRFEMNGAVTRSALGGGATFTANLANAGSLGVQVQVRQAGANAPTPHSYTTGAGHSQRAVIPVGSTYDLSAHGPDGFFRRWAGSVTGSAAGVEVSTKVDGPHGNLRLTISNGSKASVKVSVGDAYRRGRTIVVPAGGKRSTVVGTSHGWYDLTVTAAGDKAWTRQLAGRVHTGRDGSSDPQLGR